MQRLLFAAALLLPATASAQDAAAGQRVFNQCRACHTLNAGGRNGVGPNLYGLFGRPAGIVEGYRYSTSLRERGEAGLAWNEETLRAYIADPKAVVPNGAMPYAGLRNVQQQTDLLAYLREATR